MIISQGTKSKELRQTGGKSLIVSCFGANPFLFLVVGRGLGGIFKVGGAVSARVFDTSVTTDTGVGTGVGTVVGDVKTSGNGWRNCGKP